MAGETENEGCLKLRVRLKGDGARALEELACDGIEATLGEDGGFRFAEFDLSPQNLRAFANCLDRLEKADKARRAGAEMNEERRKRSSATRLRAFADCLERLRNADKAREARAEMNEERRK